MKQNVLSKSSHEFLIKHLVEIEDEKGTILKEYFPKVTAESIGFEKLIVKYVKSIEDYIKGVEIVEDTPAGIPFVLIGSTVEIQDLYDLTVEKVRIISPFLNKGQINYTYASYLSPLGRELLLKKKGDKVDVKIPAGCSQYMINNVGLTAGGFY